MINGVVAFGTTRTLRWVIGRKIGKKLFVVENYRGNSFGGAKRAVRFVKMIGMVFCEMKEQSSMERTKGRAINRGLEWDD